MSNVHDILGVARKVKVVSLTGPKAKARKRKTPGISREFASLGDDVIELVKKKKQTNKTVLKKGPIKNKWKWSPFTNSARTDQFALHHWTQTNDNDTDYSYAKMNIHRPVFHCKNQEWPQIHQIDPRWTPQLHNHFLNLMQRFSCKFQVVHDQLTPDLLKLLPTLEDLKERFFLSAQIILSLRNEKKHPLLLKPYNRAADEQRKKNLENELAQREDTQRINLLKEQLDKIQQERTSLEQKIKDVRKQLGITGTASATAQLERQRTRHLQHILGGTRVNKINLKQLPTPDTAKKHYDQMILDRKNAISVSLGPNTPSYYTAQQYQMAPADLGNVHHIVTQGLNELFGNTAATTNLLPSPATIPVVHGKTALMGQLAELAVLKAKYHNMVVSASECGILGRLEEQPEPLSEILEGFIGGNTRIEPPAALGVAKGKGKGKARAKSRKSRAGEDDSDYEG